MKSTTNKGKEGEEIAVEYLKKQGFTVIETNWHFVHKEIDIIAKKDNELVFVEVKLRNNKELEISDEIITNRKQKMLIDAADAYIEQKDLKLEARYDLITIVDNKVERHIPYAFYPEF